MVYKNAVYDNYSPVTRIYPSLKLRLEFRRKNNPPLVHAAITVNQSD